jgi:uncharacterized protein
MALDPALLQILACPKDKGPLYYIDAEDLLYNPRERLVYPIRDGIPVMLIDEASQADDAEDARLRSVIETSEIRPTFDDEHPT